MFGDDADTVWLLPAAGVPVGVPDANVVLLAVIAFIAIVFDVVAVHGTSAVMKIYPVAPLAMAWLTNDGNVFKPAVPGVLKVESKVAVPALKVALVW